VKGPRREQRLAAVVLAGAVVVTACGASADAARPGSHSRSSADRPVTERPDVTNAQPRHRHRPLAGTTVGIDPGHNGRNYAHPEFINHLVWNGRKMETCDTTGTSTNGGYTEPRFTWRMATFLRKDLRAEGARVVETRHNNHGVGPCVNRRPQIIKRGGSDVGIDIHGDGGPAAGRGFAVLEPVRDRANRHVVKSSARLGHILRHHILSGTSMPTSSYDGRRGIKHRDDLAGLNLTKVPLVLIECGNMRNAHDARLMTSPRFQKRLARAFAAAITHFVRQRHRKHSR
jgi:N-acetylmuramoyl-L-alanine amidase